MGRVFDMYIVNAKFLCNDLLAFDYATRPIWRGDERAIRRKIDSLNKTYEVQGLDGIEVNGAALGLMHIYCEVPEARGEIKRIVSGSFKLPPIKE
tara:strand:+ start:26899 stop:27183 length:285 start_codon:yes stop_codon:yes gene_type:complete